MSFMSFRPNAIEDFKLNIFSFTEEKDGNAASYID